uniref:Uncharacterized protein n=1 Tax=Panagrolaimus sp. JU765 TaxID=591449 RepID=A0AC34RR17_9BILA
MKIYCFQGLILFCFISLLACQETKRKCCGGVTKNQAECADKAFEAESSTSCCRVTRRSFEYEVCNETTVNQWSESCSFSCNTGDFCNWMPFAPPVDCHRCCKISNDDGSCSTNDYVYCPGTCFVDFTTRTAGCDPYTEAPEEVVKEKDGCLFKCKGQCKQEIPEHCKPTPPPTTTLPTTTPKATPSSTPTPAPTFPSSSKAYSCYQSGWDGEGCLNRTTPQLNNCTSIAIAADAKTLCYKLERFRASDNKVCTSYLCSENYGGTYVGNSKNVTVNEDGYFKKTGIIYSCEGDGCNQPSTAFKPFLSFVFFFYLM